MNIRERLPLGEAEFGLIKEGDGEGLFVPYYYWTFGEMRSGDCVMYAGATLKYFADGSITWVSDLSSSDTGDEWEMALGPTRAPRDPLFDLYFWYDIKDANTVKHWEQVRPPNPTYANVFSQADGGLIGWRRC